MDPMDLMDPMDEDDRRGTRDPMDEDEGLLGAKAA